MNITVDISESRDLVVIRIINKSALTDFEIGCALENISKELKAEYLQPVKTIDVSQIRDANEVE